MFIKMSSCSPNSFKKFKKWDTSLRSGKKRVLFPTDCPPGDDMSDLRFLSSPENNSMNSSPERSLTDEDICGSLCISPTIHKGIENLLVAPTKLRNSAVVSPHSSNGIVIPSSDKKLRSGKIVPSSDTKYDKSIEDPFSLTPWNDKFSVESSHITPVVPVQMDGVDAPLKNEICYTEANRKTDQSDESGSSIKPGLFYGNNRPTMELVRKLRLSRLLSDHSKVKAKLFTDEKTTSRSKKYFHRSHSNDSSVRHHKNSKKEQSKLFSGVGHGIKKRKPKKVHSKPIKLSANVNRSDPDGSIRANILKKFDFSRTPYHRLKKADCKWNYNLARKSNHRVDLDDDRSSNRKFFKSSVQSECIKKRKEPDDDLVRANKKMKANNDLLELLENNDIPKLDLEDDDQNMIPCITKHDAEIMDSGQRISYLLPTGTKPEESLENQSNIDIYSAEQRDRASSYLFAINLKKRRAVDIAKENQCTTQNDTKFSPPNKLYPLFEKARSGEKNVSALKNISNKIISSDQDNNKTKKKPRNAQLKLQKAAADINQCQIDAGQKCFGATECPICHMVYQLSDPVDQQHHDLYHNSTGIFKYKPWANEHVVGGNGADHRIILVKNSDKKSHIRKVKSILEFTENEIGTYSGSYSANWEAFLYINHDNMIVGCLIAEPLMQAYRASKVGDILLHLPEPHKVKCGINRIWTKSEFRKRGIARSLIDCLKKNYIFGQVLTVDDIAFSSTTNDGHEFARKYTARDDYLIYTAANSTKKLRFDETTVTSAAII